MIDMDKLPEDLKKVVIEDIKKYGSWATSQFLDLASVRRMLSDLDLLDTDFVWFTTVLHLINSLASKDPSIIHYTCVREFLSESGIESDKAVDLLNRALVIECQNFRKIVFNNFSINNISDINLILPERNERSEFICSKDDCNAIDLMFSDFLSSQGPSGKENCELIKESAPKRYKNYKESQFSSEYRQEAWSVWISKEKSFCSPYLKILADFVWNDRCKFVWEREKNNVPAIPKGVFIKNLKPLFSKDSKIEVVDTSINYYLNGEAIAKIPFVDPKLFDLIKKGMESFSSLNGQKLIRWQITTGFENWINRSEDIRLIRTNGGYEGIANLVGCGKNSSTIKEIKSILHAQAFCQFVFPGGNFFSMLSFKEIEKHRNGEPSKINIVLGEMLLPDFTHQLPKGENRRLIPITKLPPLIGSKNTHAAQAMLQLLALEEFSNQSDVYASKKYVVIPKDKWKELAHEAKLPVSCIDKVVMGWTQDDLFSKAFLERQGDEYVLGKDYTQVTRFLENQGEQRIEGSKGGIKSAKTKKNLVKRRYKKEKKFKAT
jgi:hypothetical protein